MPIPCEKVGELSDQLQPNRHYGAAVEGGDSSFADGERQSHGAEEEHRGSN